MNRRLVRPGLVTAGGVVAAGGTLAGGTMRTGVVLALALLLALDLQALLRRVGVRPLLPAAAPVAIGGPWMVLTGAEGSLSVLVACAFALAAALALLLGPQRGAAQGLGATVLVGLLPGLGGAAVLLLSRESGAVVVLVTVLLGAELARAARGRLGHRTGTAPDPGGLGDPGPGAALLASGLGAVLCGIAVHRWGDHGLSGEAVVGVAALATLAAVSAAGLRAALGRSDDVLIGVASTLATSASLTAPATVALLGALG